MEARDERQDEGGGRTVAILPDKSENPTTMRINQFAAGIYPTVHAHLEAARAAQRRTGEALTVGWRSRIGPQPNLRDLLSAECTGGSFLALARTRPLNRRPPNSSD